MSRQKTFFCRFGGGQRYLLQCPVKQQEPKSIPILVNAPAKFSVTRFSISSRNIGSTSSVLENEEKQESALGKFFAKSPTVSPQSLSSKVPVKSKEHSMTSLAQKLFSYESLGQAKIQHEGDLLGDIVLVTEYFTKQSHRPIFLNDQLELPQTQQGSYPKVLLCRQLGNLMNTLVLPMNDIEITSEKTIDSILRAVHLTLKAYANTASKPSADLSIDDGLEAQELLRKVSSLKSSPGGHSTFTQEKIFEWQRSLLLSLNNVLNMWAKLAGTLDELKYRRMAVLHAEHLLIDMPVAPDIISFNTVITAWANCGAQKPKHRRNDNNNEKKTAEHGTKAAERAEALLNLLLELAAAQKASGSSQPLKPTAFTYNAVMKAWVDSGDPQGAERAISLLHDMVDRNESLGHQGPNAHTFSHVFNALAKCQLQDVHTRIQELLHFMESLHIQPNTIVYNTILTAYARSKPRSAHEKHQVCEHMDDIIERMTSSLPHAKPDKITYQTLINAWMDCGIQREQTRKVVHDCGRRVVAHLETAIEQNLPLGVHTFHQIMLAFSSDAILVDKVFSLMSSHLQTKITLDSYILLLDLLQKATRGPHDVAVAEKAEQYLCEMENLAGQRQNLSPNTNCFNSVIMAWNATKTVKGAERAAIVLNNMCKAYKLQLEQFYKDRTFRLTSRPNTTSFMNAIAALGQQNGPESIPRVEDLVRKMTEFSLARKGSVPGIAKKMSPVEPNVITYNSLLALYAKYCQEDNALREKAEALIESMESMEEREKQPDKYSYTSLVIVYGKCDKSVERVMNLLDKLKHCVPRKELDNRFFKVVLKTIGESGEDNVAENVEDVLAWMESGMFGRHVRRPDALCYQMAVRGLTNNPGNLDAVQRAERLISRARESGQDAFNNICYTELIDAYVATNTPEGAKRADEILEIMEKEFASGNSNMMPRKSNYEAILNVANSDQAHGLRKRMEARLVVAKQE